MKRILLVAAALASVAGSTTAIAQDKPVDPVFLEQLRAALIEHPELVQIALNEATTREQNNRMKAMVETAQSVRVNLSKADGPGVVLGNANGKSTYVEFLDYRCHFCAQMHSEVNTLMSEDKDNRVVVVMRPVLGPQSEVLARFALAAAQQGKFRQTHDYLYENQVGTDDDGLASAAKAIGIDWPKAREAMTSPSVTAQLQAHERISEQMQVQGTPFFITPTKIHPGAVPLDQLRG